MNKKYLRNEYIKIRNNITNKDTKSKIIIDKILNLIKYKESKVICIYSNLEFEVDTSLLINSGITDNKTIAIPKVIDKNTMEFYKIDSIEELIHIGKFGIKESIGKKNNLIKKSDIDLVIVPGICFDKNKNRIGYGKGYFDRYLSDVSESVTKIGICFDEQLLTNSDIESTKNDIKMDIVITDKTNIL